MSVCDCGIWEVEMVKCGEKSFVVSWRDCKIKFSVYMGKQCLILWFYQVFSFVEDCRDNGCCLEVSFILDKRQRWEGEFRFICRVRRGGVGRKMGECGEFVGIGVIQYGRVFWWLVLEVYDFWLVGFFFRVILSEIIFLCWYWVFFLIIFNSFNR